MQSRQGWVQGYNPQTVVNENHIIIAAEVTVTAADFGHLDPMVHAAERELHAVGVSDRPGMVVADASYWNQRQMETVVERGIQVIIPPDSNTRQGEGPGWNDGLYAFMRRVIKSPAGGAIYRKRQGQIEPVYGDIKFNRKIDRFQRRGRAAVQSEWHDRALEQLNRLATELDRAHPGAGASLREAMEETLTVIRLGITGKLKHTL
jgi:hypothetical protein